MSENIGRWCAILLCIPFLLFVCIILRNNSNYNILISNCLLVFSILFFVYESLWLCGILYK